jgi:hypothetical protein
LTKNAARNEQLTEPRKRSDVSGALGCLAIFAGCFAAIGYSSWQLAGTISGWIGVNTMWTFIVVLLAMLGAAVLIGVSGALINKDVVGNVAIFLLFIAMAGGIVALALLGFEDMRRNGWYIKP